MGSELWVFIGVVLLFLVGVFYLVSYDINRQKYITITVEQLDKIQRNSYVFGYETGIAITLENLKEKLEEIGNGSKDTTRGSGGDRQSP
jgi:hypothetical protein